MFSFVVKWLGFLKHVPLFAHFFDSLIKLWMLAFNPRILDWIDELEAFVEALPDTSITVHKYGGAQFNLLDKELAHLHSNGLLDILLDRKLKAHLHFEGRVKDHHVFGNSGWISFYLKTADDVVYAKQLLQIAYCKEKSVKHRVLLR